jgi:hypothetical protein
MLKEPKQFWKITHSKKEQNKSPPPLQISHRLGARLLEKLPKLPEISFSADKVSITLKARRGLRLVTDDSRSILKGSEIKATELPGVRSKLRTLIDDISSHNIERQLSNEKFNKLLHSSKDFQSSSFDKYKTSRPVVLDSSRQKYKLNMKTKNCILKKGDVEIDKLFSPTQKTAKTIKHLNLNLNDKIKVLNFTQREIEPHTSSPRNINVENIDYEFLWKPVQCLKILGKFDSFQKIVEKKHANTISEIDNAKSKIKISEELFKQKLNYKVFTDMFYSALELNLKSKVKKIIRAYPEIVNHIDVLGKNLIHFSANNDMSRMTQILVDFGSPVDRKDKLGNSPLDYAYSNGNLEIVKVLLLDSPEK